MNKGSWQVIEVEKTNRQPMLLEGTMDLIIIIIYEKQFPLLVHTCTHVFLFYNNTTLLERNHIYVLNTNE